MEKDFEEFLRQKKIKKEVREKLANEDITSLDIFASLRAEDLNLLYEKGLTIGQFSLLSTAWKELSPKENKDSPRKSTSKHSVPTTRQELFEAYKNSVKKMREVGVESGNKSTSGKKKYVGLHFGGMVFNSSLEKGTRKKGLPSPRIIDFDLLSSYDDVLDKAKDIFFPKETNDLNAYSLATSSGVAFDINKENWRLGDFLKDHSFQPSKVRFYILFNSNRNSPESDDDATQSLEPSPESSPLPLSLPQPVRAPLRAHPPRLAPPLVPKSTSRQTVTGYTKPEVRNCVECKHPFLAPIEDSSCELPDGGLVSYHEPVLLCPVCDPNQFGLAYNTEFVKDRLPL